MSISIKGEPKYNLLKVLVFRWRWLKSFVFALPPTWFLLAGSLMIYAWRYRQFTAILGVSIFTGIYFLRKRYLLLFVFICGITIFGVRGYYFWPLPANLSTKQSVYKGIVVEEPRYRETAGRYIVKLLLPDKLATTKVILKTDKYPRYLFGSGISFNCALEPVIDMKDRPGATFSYRDYLLDLSVDYQCRYPHSVHDFIVEKGSQSMISDGLTKILYSASTIKLRLWNVLKYQLSYPYADLLIGMIIGFPNEIPPYDDLFRVTGVSHVLSVSGFNVMLFMAGISKILQPWGIRKQTIGSLLMILVFLTLAGFSAPALRAGVMGIISLMGLLGGQVRKVSVLLLWSIVAVLLINPSYLFSVSLHLSVVAVGGLLWLVPLVNWGWRIWLIKLYVTREFRWFMGLLNVRLSYWPIDGKYLSEHAEKIGFVYQLARYSWKKLLWRAIVDQQFFEDVKRLPFGKEWGGWVGFMHENFVLTVAATVATLGVVINSFGNIALLALPTNVLVLWAVELVGVVGIWYLATLLLVTFSGGLEWLLILLWPFKIVLYIGLHYFLVVNILLYRLLPDPWVTEINGFWWLLGFYGSLLIIILLLSPQLGVPHDQANS